MNWSLGVIHARIWAWAPCVQTPEDTGQKFDRQYEGELKRASIQHLTKWVECSGKRYSRITIWIKIKKSWWWMYLKIPPNHQHFCHCERASADLSLSTVLRNSVTEVPAWLRPFQSCCDVCCQGELHYVTLGGAEKAVHTRRISSSSHVWIDSRKHSSTALIWGTG